MRAKGTTILAGLLCMLLGACSSNYPNGTTASRSGESYGKIAGTGQDNNSSSMGASGTSGSMDSSASTSSDMSGSADTRASSANSAMSMDGSQSGVSIASATVQSIETVPGGMDRGSGETQSGSSGTAGSTSGNMMYRVTLRLDDGTTRAITQNSQPTYQIGDRVKVVNGLLQRY